MDQIKIGKFISTLRKEQNLTQAELAAKLGVTDRAISKWENGRGLPDLSLVVPLSEALNISINELLSGERIEKERYERDIECVTDKIPYAAKEERAFRKAVKKLSQEFKYLSDDRCVGHQPVLLP